MISLLQPGNVLQNRYLIQRVLGQGGMGAVYLALDLRLGQTPVAVKENFDTSPQSLAQFQREAIALARLSHPNLPKVMDHFIEPSGRQYLVMEFISGDDLDTIVQQRGALPEAQVLAWADQLLDALTYLHTQPQPVIHRDVKPANIKLTPDGKVKLVDFGLVKFYDPANLQTATIVHGMGSPQYAPPEQYDVSGHTDARSDVYALGATLYHLLTGQPPATAMQRMANRANLRPPCQLAPGLRASTEATILKALDMTMGNRFQSADEMRQALGGKSVKVPRPSQGLPPWSLWLAGAVIAVLALALLITLVVNLPLSGTPVAALTNTSQPSTATPRQTSTLVPTSTPPAPTTRGTNTPIPTNTPTPTSRPTNTPTATPGIGSTRISDKDGMVMVYVPAGEFLMGSADGDKGARSAEKPQHTVYLDAFWIDRTEVTNAMFVHFVTATGYETDAEKEGSGWADIGGGGWGRLSGADWRHPDGRATNISGLDNHPVVQVSWNDAQAYCQWAGAVLPTEAQWEKAARGTDGRLYPWGNQIATCDYAVMRDGSKGGCGRETTWPVGSKPRDTSPYGALDMAGNVSEWVADWYDDKYYANSPSRNPIGPSSGLMRVLHGGNFNFIASRVRVADRTNVDQAERFALAGIRCVVTNTWIPTPPALMETPMPALTATSRPPTPTVTQPPAGARVRSIDNMVMVYVPAGEFLMGSDQSGDDNEKPQHKVYLDAFWVDRTEVTNAQYNKCVQAGKCKASSCAYGSKYNGDNQPVVCVDWNDAQAYCQWAGAALPTEAQWEKAARGTDGRVYPWGNQITTCDYAVMDDGKGTGCGKSNAAWAVGSKPQGASPYGALDMAGNVLEWVADWYDDKYYANSPSRNPIGPSSESSHILRGGSWVADAPTVRATYRWVDAFTHRDVSFGFRCVRSGSGG